MPSYKEYETKVIYTKEKHDFKKSKFVLNILLEYELPYPKRLYQTIILYTNIF